MINLYIALDLDSRGINRAITDIQGRHQSFKNWCNGRDGAEVLFELRRWAGSTNQQFHYLTARYDNQIEIGDEVERVLEVRLRTDGSMLLNGWPEKVLR